jgi:hypothetical protein
LSSTFQLVRDRRGSALNCLTTRSHAPLWWPEKDSTDSSSAKKQYTSILLSGPCHDDDLSDSEDDMPVTLSTFTPAVLTPVQCQALFQPSATAMDTR